MKRTWLLLVLLTFSLPAFAGEMYSWTDANGVKHFSDSPPPPNVQKSQKVKVKGGVTSSVPAEDEQKKDDATKAGGPALASAAGYSPEMIKGNCEVARSNLSILQDQKLPVDAEGFPSDLEGAKKRQADIDKANQQIKLFCSAK